MQFDFWCSWHGYSFKSILLFILLEIKVFVWFKIFNPTMDVGGQVDDSQM
jgi:hypothetical protein